MNDMIRVVIADDHPVVRKGIREILEDEPDLVVVGEASDGQAVVDLALDLRPDVVIMDVHMPRLTGIDATRQIHATAPELRILVLTSFDDPPYIRALLDLGIQGYVLKTAESYAIVRAVRTVANGSTTIERQLLQAASDHVQWQTARPSIALTAREYTVLRLVADGLTNKQIGARLAISDRTVQGHLQTAFGKLGVRTRTEAVTAALQDGLLALPESMDPSNPDR
jgi:DNA-binding NarL/FixJ family response regulator